jgi:carboxypeptidase Taq
MGSAAWDDLVQHLHELEVLDGARALLGWDEQTFMPRKAAEQRGEQLALLSWLAHERITDARVGRWLEALDENDPLQAACRRNLGRVYERERRVPAELVERLARAKSAGFARWLEAKERSDYSSFAPALERVLGLSCERAAAIAPDRHPYDVVLEESDPGTSVAMLRPLFARLRDGLLPLLDAIAAKPAPDGLHARFELAGQWELSREVARALGFDFDAGRLDHAEHPFTVGLGAGDVRITTHLRPDDLLGGLGATIHECGHALYELGLPRELMGTTVAEAASAGLHESQSRLWENFIGRSLPFCRWLARQVNRYFPAEPVSAEQLYQAQNRVARGLCRIQADEVSYNLHIIVRFELELGLFERRLGVGDLGAAWAEKYRQYLGVEPATDAEGVLQDAHWSDGSFGYFPSYTLGNLYAASFGVALGNELPGLWSEVEQGQFGSVLEWLRTHVHGQGHWREAPEIVRSAAGDRDPVQDLLAHLWARHGTLYGVAPRVS